jgi:hypothetical protein
VPSGCSTSPEFDPDKLSAALRAVPPAAWSQPSTFAGTNVHEGYRSVSVVVGGNRQPVAEPFGFVLDAYEPVWSAFLACIDPGGFVRTHKDAGPYRERWHVPILGAGLTTGLAAEAGVPFRVNHWEWHSVDNPTDRPRIHLIIDRVAIANPARSPWTIQEA